MNKAELIEEVANNVGITKKETGNIIDATVETITNTLSKGEKVTLVGFGTFQIMAVSYTHLTLPTICSV